MPWSTLKSIPAEISSDTAAHLTLLQTQLNEREQKQYWKMMSSYVKWSFSRWHADYTMPLWPRKDNMYNMINQSSHRRVWAANPRPPDYMYREQGIPIKNYKYTHGNELKCFQSSVNQCSSWTASTAACYMWWCTVSLMWRCVRSLKKHIFKSVLVQF